MTLTVSVPRCGEPPTGGENRGTPKMYDQPLFLQTLSRFAVVLLARYDLEAALSELTESATAVLGLSGGGVTMAEDGRLRFVSELASQPVRAASAEVPKCFGCNVLVVAPRQTLGASSSLRAAPEPRWP